MIVVTISNGGIWVSSRGGKKWMVSASTLKVVGRIYL